MNDLTLDDPSARTPRTVVPKKPAAAAAAAADAFEASLRYYPQSGTPITPRTRPSPGPKPSSAVTRPPSSTPKPPSAASKPLVTPPRSKPLPPIVASTEPTPVADIGERVTVRNPLANVYDAVRCAGCEEPISGQVMTALGKQWHPDHFVCKHCGTELEHVEFQEKDGNPYCHLDYHELFSPRCEYCKTPIEDVSHADILKYLYHVLTKIESYLDFAYLVVPSSHSPFIPHLHIHPLPSLGMYYGPR